MRWVFVKIHTIFREANKGRRVFQGFLLAQWIGGANHMARSFYKGYRGSLPGLPQLHGDNA